MATPETADALARMHRTNVRYASACSAVQSGLAFVHARNSLGGGMSGPGPEAMSSAIALAGMTALASLLISKGVCTEDEYLEGLTVEMEAQQAAYEERLGVKLP